MADDNEELEGLIQATRRGQREAFSKLVLACERDLRLWLTARAPLGVDVDEIAHQAFIAAFEHIDRYTPGARVRAWLAGIARNMLRRHLQQSARQPGIQQLSTDLPNVIADDLSIPTRWHEHLQACLEALNERHRRVVLWRHRDGVDLPSVAAKDGRSPGAMATLLSSLRRRLRDCVQGQIQAENAS